MQVILSSSSNPASVELSNKLTADISGYNGIIIKRSTEDNFAVEGIIVYAILYVVVKAVDKATENFVDYLFEKAKLRVKEQEYNGDVYIQINIKNETKNEETKILNILRDYPEIEEFLSKNKD